MLFRLVFVSLTISQVLAIDCDAVGDGIHEVGCKSYVLCYNGMEFLTECGRDEVFNSVINACDAEENVGLPCGLKRNCTNISDGSYPDLENNCTSYYTCKGGFFFGHNLCPEGLVWDGLLNICNFEYDTCPPCGTRAANYCPDLLLVG